MFGYGIGLGINLRQREREERGPDIPCAEGDLAAFALQATGNAGDDFAGFLFHARDGSVTLIERPNGAGSGGEEARFEADWDGGNEFVRLGVYLQQGVVREGRNPYESIAEGGIF